MSTSPTRSARTNSSTGAARPCSSRCWRSNPGATAMRRTRPGSHESHRHGALNCAATTATSRTASSSVPRQRDGRLVADGDENGDEYGRIATEAANNDQKVDRSIEPAACGSSGARCRPSGPGGHGARAHVRARRIRPRSTPISTTTPTTCSAFLAEPRPDGPFHRGSGRDCRCRRSPARPSKRINAVVRRMEELYGCAHARSE